MVTLEQVLDLIAEKLILSEAVDPDVVRQNQKVIRNGLLSLGANRGDSIVLYDRDVKANLEDYRLGTYTEITVSESPVSMQGTLESIISSYDDGTTIDQIDVVVSGDYAGLTVAITGPVGFNQVTYDITTLITGVGNDGKINPLNVSQFINVEQFLQDVDPERADELYNTEIYELLGIDTARQKRINAFCS